MQTITRIHGREILDSRGNPTVEVDVWAGDVLGRAAVPSGASTGEREALELRDGDTSRYLGRGVRQAVAHVNGEIAQALVGQPLDQRAIDARMIALDGTPAKSRLGANALLGVSMAVARAGAAAAHRPLYAHFAALGRRPRRRALRAAGADDEHPERRRARRQQRGPAGVHGDAGRRGRRFADAVRTGAEIFHALRAILKKAGHSTGVGDEGGFAPSLKSNQEALDVVLEAVGKAGFTAGKDVFLALDVASSELWDNGRYVFKKSEEATRTADDMVQMYTDWVRQYPIVSIEDGLAEGDWAGLEDADRPLWATASSSWATTSSSPTPRSCAAGIAEGVGNSILVKLNQIGTVSETLDAIAMARDGRLHDDHLAPLGRDRGRHDRRPGCRARRPGQIKTGSASRSDRVAKYNQLMRIEEELGAGARYAGRTVLRQLAGRP